MIANAKVRFLWRWNFYTRSKTGQIRLCAVRSLWKRVDNLVGKKLTFSLLIIPQSVWPVIPCYWISLILMQINYSLQLLCVLRIFLWHFNIKRNTTASFRSMVYRIKTHSRFFFFWKTDNYSSGKIFSCFYGTLYYVYRIDPCVRLLIRAYSWAKWMGLGKQLFFTHRIGRLVRGGFCMPPFVGIR
jgi:hypothetical protein